MKIELKDVRIAFPVLFVPEPFQGTGDPAYTAAFLLPRNHPQVQEIQAAIKQIAREKWKDKADEMLKVMERKEHTFFRDGDFKAKWAGFGDHWYVGARSARRPTIVNYDTTPLTAADGKPYSGCYVNGIVEIWCQDNGYGQRINASLGGVQFIRDGESFEGGTVVSANEFADLSVRESAEDLL